MKVLSEWKLNEKLGQAESLSLIWVLDVAQVQKMTSVDWLRKPKIAVGLRVCALLRLLNKDTSVLFYGVSGV